MPDYEKLMDVGSQGLLRAFDYPILDANLGDGFYAAVIVGDSSGLRRGKLVWSNAHRDAGYLIQAKTYLGSNIGSPVSRHRYIQQLVHRCLSNGNQPFWIEDVDDVGGARTVVLCRLLPLTFEQQQDRRNPLLYSFSIQYQQIRGAPAQS